MKMHSEYRLPVFITVDEMVKAGDEAAILAVNIFGDLEGRTDLSYEQKEKALHLANEMLFQKLVTGKDNPTPMTTNEVKNYFNGYPS